jgi:hypothetical protein
MITTAETHAGPKASRARVWQAVDRIVRSGRRPTVEGVRELLGGGSPNSVTAYINEWYQDLGSRLAAAEMPVEGLPHEAVTLLVELWRVAMSATKESSAPPEAPDQLLAVERTALAAEAKALDTLNKELHKHRASLEQSVAEARALLAHREAALEQERTRAASLDQALAQARLELAIARERRRVAAPRSQRPSHPPRRLRAPKTARVRVKSPASSPAAKKAARRPAGRIARSKAKKRK